MIRKGYKLSENSWLPPISQRFTSKTRIIRSINFSCPMNVVPKEDVDAYLERNPVMQAAWEASGYKLG